MSRDLATAKDTDEILHAAASHIHSVFLSQVLLLLPDAEGRVSERAGESGTFILDTASTRWRNESSITAAPPARPPTPSPPPRVSTCRSRPRGVVGVLGVHPADPESLAAPERLHFLEAFANQIALAVE